MKADEFTDKILKGPDDFDTSSGYFFNGVTKYDSWVDFKSKKNSLVELVNNYVKFAMVWKEEASKHSVKTTSLMISVKLAVVIIKSLTTPDGYKILKQVMAEQINQQNLILVGKKINWYNQAFAHQASVLDKLANNIEDQNIKKLVVLVAKAFGQLSEQTKLANREITNHIKLKFGT